MSLDLIGVRLNLTDPTRSDLTDSIDVRADEDRASNLVGVRSDLTYLSSDSSHSNNANDTAVIESGLNLVEVDDRKNNDEVAENNDEVAENNDEVAENNDEVAENNGEVVENDNRATTDEPGRSIFVTDFLEQEIDEFNQGITNRFSRTINDIFHRARNGEEFKYSKIFYLTKDEFPWITDDDIKRERKLGIPACKNFPREIKFWIADKAVLYRCKLGADRHGKAMRSKMDAGGTIDGWEMISFENSNKSANTRKKYDGDLSKLATYDRDELYVFWKNVFDEVPYQFEQIQPKLENIRSWGLISYGDRDAHK
ncbi:3429_t:CDS:2, partial [Racocetra fulgida]